MKFSCTTQDLLHALQLAGRAISSQQALPVLGNILLQAEGKRCTVSATDLELSIVTSFEAAIENEGSITIPAKAILNFAQYVSDPEVLLETIEGTQLRCTSKHAKTLLSGEAATEYPTIASLEKKTSLKLNAEPFLDALHLVTFTSARTTLRPVLSGVYFRTEKNRLILVATDSYRLSEYAIDGGGGGEEISCIIPVKVLEEVRAILGARKAARNDGEEKESTKEPVLISLGAQQVEFQIGASRLLSRLIEGKFPDYQQIIPKSAATTVRIQTRELTVAVKRMHYFAKEVNNNVTIHVCKDSLRVFTPQTQLGRDEAVLPATIEGKETKIALSSSYLLDFLGHVGDDEVELKITDSMHPALFHLPRRDKFLHLIMPLRMQEE